jgi:hypothetical protein
MVICQPALVGNSLYLDDTGKLVALSDFSTVVLCQVNQDVAHHAKNGELQTRSTTTCCHSGIPSLFQLCKHWTLIDTHLRLQS